MYLPSKWHICTKPLANRIFFKWIEQNLTVKKTLGTFPKCHQNTFVDGNLFLSDCCLYQTLNKEPAIDL